MRFDCGVVAGGGKGGLFCDFVCSGANIVINGIAKSERLIFFIMTILLSMEQRLVSREGKNYKGLDHPLALKMVTN